jgi:ubiquinone/menaquinone biosynthesis C-methylase UbiE/uncharacterized protein YbaR (Trm112 family)
MIKNMLICPDCSNVLFEKKDYYFCQSCQTKYPIKNGIPIILPSNLSDNKIKEDEVHGLKNKDNSWYNYQIWYYLIHLSSHIVRFEKEILSKIKGKKVLEIACGNSYASILLKRKHPQFEVYATDISFLCLDIQAKQMSKIMEAEPDHYLVCDGEKLPFRDNYFNTVFIIASLHHFPNIGQFFSEVKRVLKPGGQFIGIDGMMPKVAQKIFGEESDRTKKFGVLERQISYNQWNSFLKEAGIGKEALHLYYNPQYIHSYPTNPDEKKLIKTNWIFNVFKEIIYGAFLSKMNETLIKNLGFQYIFPSGVVIQFQKPKS